MFVYKHSQSTSWVVVKLYKVQHNFHFETTTEATCSQPKQSEGGLSFWLACFNSVVSLYLTYNFINCWALSWKSGTEGRNRQKHTNLLVRHGGHGPSRAAFKWCPWEAKSVLSDLCSCWWPLRARLTPERAAPLQDDWQVSEPIAWGRTQSEVIRGEEVV